MKLIFPFVAAATVRQTQGGRENRESQIKVQLRIVVHLKKSKKKKKDKSKFCHGNTNDMQVKLKKMCYSNIILSVGASVENI